MGAFAGVAAFGAWLALGCLQAVGFFEGLDRWLEVTGFFAACIFVVAMVFRPLGSVFVAAVSFYGMWKGWHWPLIGAAAAAFPFLVLSFVGVGFAGLISAFGNLRARA
jgi:hypothetical protein